MNPNKYNQRLRWLKRSSTLDPIYGEHQESFTDIGSLWGRVVFTGGGNESDDYGVRKELVNATIYINQWPHITNLDRLVDVRFGDTWYIDAVTRNFTPIELVIQATRKPPESATGADSGEPFGSDFGRGFI